MNYLKLAMAELCLEQDGPIDSALYAWAAEQEPGVVKMFADRFLCDHLRAILYDRSKLIELVTLDELKSLK
jgi:hypothetical protein